MTFEVQAMQIPNEILMALGGLLLTICGFFVRRLIATNDLFKEETKENFEKTHEILGVLRERSHKLANHIMKVEAAVHRVEQMSQVQAKNTALELKDEMEEFIVDAFGGKGKEFQDQLAKVVELYEQALEENKKAQELYNKADKAVGRVLVIEEQIAAITAAVKKKTSSE